MDQKKIHKIKAGLEITPCSGEEKSGIGWSEKGGGFWEREVRARLEGTP